MEGSVHGLRTAPKAWLAKVVAYLTRLGAKQHPLDQCVYMFYTETAEVAGANGVYIDDFLFVESKLPEQQEAGDDGK